MNPINEGESPTGESRRRRYLIFALVFLAGVGFGLVPYWLAAPSSGTASAGDAEHPGEVAGVTAVGTGRIGGSPGIGGVGSSESGTTESPGELFARRGNRFSAYSEFFEMLDRVPRGSEGEFLATLTESVDSTRLNRSEIAMLSDWIAERDGRLALDWLATISKPAAHYYGLADHLLTSVAANNPGLARELIESPEFADDPHRPAIYAGLLQSDPLLAAAMLKDAPSHYRQAMQNSRLRDAIRKEGLQAAFDLVENGQSSSVTREETLENGKTNTYTSSGVNSNLIREFFTIIQQTKPQPTEKILDTLQKSSWFGTDMLETTGALSYLAEIDGRAAVEIGIAMHEDQTTLEDYRLIQSGFTSWARHDEAAALAYLNTHDISDEYVVPFVGSLYQATSNPEVKAEIEQILKEKGLESPFKAD